MNFRKFDNSSLNNNKSHLHNSNNKSRAWNFIFNSNNKLFKKESPTENEINSDKRINSQKKEVFLKLNSFSNEKQQVIFSNGIQEILYQEPETLEKDKFFFNISNKKFSTPPRNTKSSYKKTKEHIKTPYRTTKSRSSKNKSKSDKDNNKSNFSTKSSNYWKSLLYVEEIMNNNISQEINIEINRICSSVILENPYGNKNEYRLLFNNISPEENEEDLNKSI